jgi:hypothetical protein
MGRTKLILFFFCSHSDPRLDMLIPQQTIARRRYLSRNEIHHALRMRRGADVSTSFVCSKFVCFPCYPALLIVGVDFVMDVKMVFGYVRRSMSSQLLLLDVP